MAKHIITHTISKKWYKIAQGLFSDTKPLVKFQWGHQMYFVTFAISQKTVHDRHIGSMKG